MDIMTSADSTIVLFSPSGQSPASICTRLLTLAEEDGITILGAPASTSEGALIIVANDDLNDALSWLDDVALAEGLGMRVDNTTVRFGDEDIAFTIKTDDEEDALLGASRFGIEPLLESLAEEKDFITVSRFDIDDPANEEEFITARPLATLEGITVELGHAGHRSTTILSRVGQATTVILRWMNGEDLDDLDWAHN